MVNHRKIVVFDMDETLGHFVQLGALYDVLEHIYDKPMSQSYFNQLIELYPNMLRPNILQILNYVKTKKQNKKCSNVYIYTNNQGPKSWGNHIRKYFESKLSYSLFDDIIGAYKIRGILNDERRSTNKKTFDDLQSITKIDGTTKICFLDDQYHKNSKEYAAYGSFQKHLNSSKSSFSFLKVKNSVIKITLGKIRPKGVCEQQR